MYFPEDIKYTRTHEWVRVEENVLTVGITAHAVKEMKGINHVNVNQVVSGTAYKPGLELQPLEENDLQDPKAKDGLKFLEGKIVTEVDSSKNYFFIYSPVRGKVIAMNDRVNKKVKDGPKKVCLIDKDPYGEGWIAKIEILDPNSLIPLMDAKEYQEFLLEEEGSKWRKWESGDF